MEGILGVPHLDQLIGKVPEGSRIMLVADPGTDGPDMLWQAAAHLLEQREKVIIVAWDRSPDRVREALRRHAVSDAAIKRMFVVDANSGQFSGDQQSAYHLEDPSDANEVRDLLRTLATDHPDAWLVFDSLSGAYDALGSDERGWQDVTEGLSGFRGVLGLFMRWPYIDPDAALGPSFEAILSLRAVEQGVIRNQAFHIHQLMWKGQWDAGTRIVAKKGDRVSVVVPKLVVVGPPNAGKTTFISTVSDVMEGTEREGTTVAMDRGRYEADGITAEVWGSPGQSRFDALLDNILSHATGAVVLVDSTDPDSFDRAKELVERIRSMGVGMAVVANKQDLDGAVPPEELQRILGVPGNVPVLGCKATEPQSAKATIHRLLRSLLSMGVRP